MLPLSHKIIATVTVLVIVLDTVLPASAASEFVIYADMLAVLGIVNGEVSEAWYRLGDPVTRAEAAKIAVKLSGGGTAGCKGNIYTDVTASLGDLCEYIEAAANDQIVSRSYDLFRFSEPVTRAELVKMFLVAAGKGPSDVPAGFSDVSPSLGDLVGYINAGVEADCIKRGSFFLPDVPAVRGEAFKVAACMAKYKTPSDGSPARSLVWSDEFNGNSLDSAKWNTETGSDGWWNDELQDYTDIGNVFVTNGQLVIEARKENNSGTPRYSSARINTHTKASWTYGKIEARIKLPSGQGIWPAFWMLGENIDTVSYPQCGEIDIVEMVGGKSEEDGTPNETTVWGSVHRPDNGPRSSGEVKSITSSFMNPRKKNFSDEFHTYGIEWDEKTIKHSVDGRVYRVTDISGKNDGFEVFHKPFYIILNVAVGGRWPGSPDQTTIFPQRMVVDWVRVYR